jgi:hypothetical protein
MLAGTPLGVRRPHKCFLIQCTLHEYIIQLQHTVHYIYADIVQTKKVFSVAKFKDPSETIRMVPKFQLWFQLDTLAI